MSAVIQEPGQGERHVAGAAEIVVKATSEDTNGTFYLGEVTIGPGFEGPPLHTHERLTDMFYVLEGELTVNVEGEDRLLPAGSFACFPPGTPHSFSNPGRDPVRILNMSTPGGWELYMRELAEASVDGPLTPEQMGEIASRHDFRPA